MDASKYSVTFGYLETTTLNGRPYTHRGQDRPTPVGTPIKIGDTTIGLTGNSGLVTGPHLHTQAGTDQWAQNTVNPSNYEFKPGTVTHTGYADQWGHHIIIKVGTHYIVYAHLSKINVKKGDVIKASAPAQGGNMINLSQLNHLVRFYLGKEPTQADRDGLVGKKTWAQVVSQIENGNSFKNRIANSKAGKLPAVSHLPKKLRDVFVDPKDAVITQLKADVSKFKKNAEDQARVASQAVDDAVAATKRAEQAEAELEATKELYANQVIENTGESKELEDLKKEKAETAGLVDKVLRVLGELLKKIGVK